MEDYHTVSDITKYFLDHPDEIDVYIAKLFENYAQDNDTATLLSRLRDLCRVKGITFVAEASGLSRKGVQKALSAEGNPTFETVNAILHALGYQFSVRKVPEMQQNQEHIHNEEAR